MRLRKAILDFTNFFWIITLALTIIAGYYFAFQSLEKPLTKLIEEGSRQVLVVTPKGGTCQVAVIRQS